MILLRMLLTLTLFLVAAPLQAAEWVRIEAAIEAQKPARDAGSDGPVVLVGQPFHLSIVARHSKGGVALLPEPLDLGPSLGERRAARSHERRTEGDEEVDRYLLELVAFEAGELTVPAIPLALGSTQAASVALPLAVGSVLSGDEQLVAASTLAEALPELEKMAAPSPNPRSVAVPDQRPLVALAILGAAALTFLGLGWLRRRRATAKITAPSAPPRPAHEVALLRLISLQRSGLLERGEHKTFHVELSETLRAYAGGRYGFESVELTVPELMEELRQRETTGLDHRVLRELLETSDLVKFAKLVVPDEESKRMLSTAFALVEATRPVPEGPVAEAAAS